MNAHRTAAVPADGEPPAAAAPDGAAAPPETEPAPGNPQAPPETDPLRHNRGSRSTIADLPPPVRAEICREIRAGTPDSAIAADLRERGYAISRSAIYRFRKAAADSLADWSAMRDAAALWSQGGTDAALPEMLRLAAFAIVARMDTAAPDCADAAHAVARIARAARDLAAAKPVAEIPAAAAPRRPAPESVDDPRLPSLPPPGAGAPSPAPRPTGARAPPGPRGSPLCPATTTANRPGPARTRAPRRNRKTKLGQRARRAGRRFPNRRSR